MCDSSRVVEAEARPCQTRPCQTRPCQPRPCQTRPCQTTHESTNAQLKVVQSVKSKEELDIILCDEMDNFWRGIFLEEDHGMTSLKDELKLKNEYPMVVLDGGGSHAPSGQVSRVTTLVSSLKVFLEDERGDGTDSGFEDHVSSRKGELSRQNSALDSVPEQQELQLKLSSSDEEDSTMSSSPISSHTVDIGPLATANLYRQDSLLEAVLAAKSRGWSHLQRTDSLASVSSDYNPLGCACDDCLLGMSDQCVAARAALLPPLRKKGIRPRGRTPPPIHVSKPTSPDLLPLAILSRRSGDSRGLSLSPGYEKYKCLQHHLPLPDEYDNSFHDDLSSDEAIEIPRMPESKPSNWRKVRNIVQWTPFIQSYKKHKYPWVQLAGHQGNFLAGTEQGTILKKLCPSEEVSLQCLMYDSLKPFVPRYLGCVTGRDKEKYLQLQDLLSDFSSPSVMDIKMGVRTYLEEELAKAREKPKLRKDMYEKMVQIDPDAPTEAEHKAKAITKPRYMVWRETISSTANLGFRIEGVRRGDGSSSKDFKTVRSQKQVVSALASFIEGAPNVASLYVERLKAIRATIHESQFFKSHEVIGSSLLFVHNETKASVWLIDFAKTIPLPEGIQTSHCEPWCEGTHEDGYLLGLSNLIGLFTTIVKEEEVENRTSMGDSMLLAAQEPKGSEQTNCMLEQLENSASELLYEGRHDTAVQGLG